MTTTVCTDRAKEGHLQDVANFLRWMNETRKPEVFVRLLRMIARVKPVEDYLTYGGYGNTFLGQAAMHAPQLIDTIVRLNRSGNIPNLGNHFGETPLLKIVCARIPDERKLLSARRLIELGASVNLASSDNFATTPLLEALNTNQLALAKLFLANGAVRVEREEQFEGPHLTFLRLRAEALRFPDRFAQIQREIEEEKRAVGDAVVQAIPSMPSALAPILADYAGHPLHLEQVHLPSWPTLEPSQCSVQ